MELKSCPHCGGKAHPRQSYSYKAKLYFVFCKCDLCGAQGKAFTSAEEITEESAWDSVAVICAVDAWNMRYTEGGIG